MNNKWTSYELERLITQLKNCYKQTVYVIVEEGIYETHIERGGYDHLGMLPDKEYQVRVGTKYKVGERLLKFMTIDALIDQPIYFTKEDAEWQAALLQYQYDHRKELKNEN